MFLEIGLIFLLLIANGAFAMAEIAVVSARKARLKKRADKGDERARAALELANAPNDFLSTVQVGITLVGVLAGAYSGATLATRLGGWLDTFSWIEPRGETVAFGIVVSLVTYFSLVIGELVPKRIALNNPERIAAAVAMPMKGLAKLAAPVVSFLSWSTDRATAAFGLRNADEPPVSEDEVKGMIEQGLGAGVFHRAEKEMLDGVFRLDAQTAVQLMTPRSRIVWLNIDDPADATWRRIVRSGHSQFPVYQGHRDNVIGVATVKSLWANMALAGAVDLRSVLTEPLVVPETMKAGKLLELFRRSGRHMALVSDEFGDLQGLVTLHDVVEAIFGQLPDKEQRHHLAARRREDGSWIVDAALDIPEVKKNLEIAHLPGEESGDFVSLGGFMIAQLGHIPQEGEKVVAEGFVFEVLDMDGQRIDKVLVCSVGKAHA